MFPGRDPLGVSVLGHFFTFFDFPDATDDIIIPPLGIEQCFRLARKHNLWVCGPAFNREHSRITHKITAHHPGNILRYTNFVENNVPFIDTRVLHRFMTIYPYELLGWGVDFLMLYAMGQHETKRYAIIDQVQCINPEAHRKKNAVNTGDPSDKREWYKIPGARTERSTWVRISRSTKCPFYWKHLVHGCVPEK